MTLKVGYKQTLVGLIPNEWDVTSLGELADIERGKFSARPRNDPNFFGGNVPFIQTGDVTRSSGNITDYAQTLNAAGVAVSRVFPAGTLFFTIAANIGDVGIADFRSACPDSLVAITPNFPHEKKWLLYELSSRKDEFEALASPGAQLNINLEKLRPYLLPVPTPVEQRAIATAISDVDALIAGLEKLITKKRDLKQAAMQQLLTGQTRLPGFSGEWVVKRLGDLLTVCHGKNQRDVEVANGPVPILATGGQIGTASKALCEKPSVLIGRKGTINRPQYMEEPFWTVDTLFYSDVKNGNLAKYLYFRFLLIDWMQYNEASGVPSLSAKTIEGIEVKCPELPEQKAIAAVLSDMDTELSALESRLAKTRDFKQGMMQELLTGRTRLI